MHLKGLPKLEVLHFAETDLTDAGCAHLHGHINLWRFSLYGTHVTDEGLKCIRRMKKLTMLDIGETQITDAGLVELAHVPTIENLALILHSDFRCWAGSIETTQKSEPGRFEVDADYRYGPVAPQGIAKTNVASTGRKSSYRVWRFRVT